MKQQNKIYAAIIGYCEELENEKLYRGNGHHLAQMLTKLIAVGLLSDQNRKIYNALETKGQTVEQIAAKVDLPSGHISAALGIISKGSGLVYSTPRPNDKKNKLWHK